MTPHPGLGIRALQAQFATDPGAADQVLRQAYEAAAEGAAGVWIHRAPLEHLEEELCAARARRERGEPVPLLGIPFAVKDNIDVAGMPTTAACPAYSYLPAASAFVVDRLRALGAIPIGKTNLDQFATGLSGVRSPYGIPRNPFDPRYVTGGSSSGSAVAVARAQVTFALGTDTAGSGRVPAAFNHVVGLKPTRGSLSTRGVVPACASLDCVSILAGSSEDALSVFEACQGFDPEDPFSRELPGVGDFPGPLRFGVPRAADLEFFGDREAARLFEAAERALSLLGGQAIEIDFAPFRQAAELLYSGPWVAERLVAAGELLDKTPEAIHPVVRGILEGARSRTALDAFRGQYRLGALARAAAAEWQKMDVLLVPTTPTVFTLAEVERDPVGLNTKLGTYTNFVNLLDLAGIAIPSGFRADGLPLGVTLLGRAGSDRALARLGSRLHRALEPTSLAVRAPLPPAPEPGTPHPGPASAPRDGIALLVVGAHLAGEPLHHQLTERRARLVRECRTAKTYRLYALAGTSPPKPGLVHDAAFDGPGIAVEIYSLGPDAFGTFVQGVPAPLAIGTVELEDGSTVKGFVCEPRALEGATDITEHGGWRAYLRAVRGGRSG